MGAHKDYHVEFETMPDKIILDFEEIFWKLRCDVSTITRMIVDWDAALQQLFQGICLLEHHPLSYPGEGVVFRNSETLHEVIQEMVYGDALFEVNTLASIPGAQPHLERVLLTASLKMKEQLLFLNAYRFGKFPYSFRTMITDGCLLFSKNESIYDSPIFDC